MKSNASVAALTNKELLSKCKEYGREALQWKWKFAGLLPEVEKRGLWKEAGFESVFHFSKVLAGMSEAQVKQALRLERKFVNMPKLQELFHDGAVSPNKLDRIGSVVNEENEEEIAQVVQMHSKQAVATLVRDVQRQSLPGQSMTETHGGTNATSMEVSGTAAVGQEILHVQNPGDADDHILSELQLSQEVQARLLNLKEKGFDVNVLLMELLDMREEMIAEEKNEIADEIEKKEELEQEMWHGCPPHTWYGLSESWKGQVGSKKRYVNARTRRVIRAEYGTKCSIETCHQPAQELHHTRRFALAPNHNPKFLAPLCKAHHELAARVDMRLIQKRNFLGLPLP